MQDITDIFTEKPCKDALDWLETQPSLDAAWDNCERGDWLWWAVQHMDGKMPTKGQSAQYARWCAKRASDYAAAAAAYTARAAAAAAAYATDYYADDADYDAEKQAQAEWIREHISNPFEGE